MSRRKAEGPPPFPVSADATLEQLIDTYRSAKDKLRAAELEAEEARAEILARVWSDNLPTTLAASGFEGMRLEVRGEPRLALRARKPRRFQSARFQQDYPALYSKYTSEAENFEVRLEIL